MLLLWILFSFFFPSLRLPCKVCHIRAQNGSSSSKFGTSRSLHLRIALLVPVAAAGFWGLFQVSLLGLELNFSEGLAPTVELENSWHFSPWSWLFHVSFLVISTQMFRSYSPSPRHQLLSNDMLKTTTHLLWNTENTEDFVCDCMKNSPCADAASQIMSRLKTQLKPAFQSGVSKLPWHVVFTNESWRTHTLW